MRLRGGGGSYYFIAQNILSKNARTISIPDEDPSISTIIQAILAKENSKSKIILFEKNSNLRIKNEKINIDKISKISGSKLPFEEAKAVHFINYLILDYK